MRTQHAFLVHKSGTIPVLPEVLSVGNFKLLGACVSARLLAQIGWIFIISGIQAFTLCLHRRILGVYGPTRRGLHSPSLGFESWAGDHLAISGYGMVITARRIFHEAGGKVAPRSQNVYEEGWIKRRWFFQQRIQE